MFKFYVGKEVTRASKSSMYYGVKGLVVKVDYIGGSPTYYVKWDSTKLIEWYSVCELQTWEEYMREERIVKIDDETFDIMYVLAKGYKPVQIGDMSGSIVDWFEKSTQGIKVSLEFSPYKGEGTDWKYILNIYKDGEIDINVDAKDYKDLIERAEKIVEALTL